MLLRAILRVVPRACPHVRTVYDTHRLRYLANLHMLAVGPRTYDFFLFLKGLDVAVEHVLLLVQLLAFVIFPIQMLVATLPRYHTQSFTTGRHSRCGSVRSDRGGARQWIAAYLRPVLLNCPASDDTT